VDKEQAIETQRLRLLRLVVGLVFAVGFLSVGPVSRGFSVWACGFVGSVLSRAELATRYLLVAHAQIIMARRGFGWDGNRFSVPLPCEFEVPAAEMSVADCLARLRALRAVLKDLPRHALRLIRRIEKQLRRVRADRPKPHPDARFSAPLHALRLPESRIERPPDKALPALR